MNDNSMDMEYAGIEANIREFNKTQGNPLSLPHGFFQAQSSSGRKLGFGFYCTVCKIHIPGRAPNQVKHCGKVSKMPAGLCYDRKARMKHLTLAERFDVQRFWWNLKTVVLKSSSHA
jgi:hypothetical protein